MCLFAYLLKVKLREDQLELALDERRNKLLFADTVISLVGVVLALIAAVAGLFGMNLTSGSSPAKGTWLTAICSVQRLATKYFFLRVYLCVCARLCFFWGAHTCCARGRR